MGMRKSFTGGLRVNNHAITRYRERCFHPRMRRLTAQDIRANIRSLIRSGQDVISPAGIARAVQVNYDFGDTRFRYCQVILLGESTIIGQDWDVITILTEEMYQSSMEGCPYER